MTAVAIRPAPPQAGDHRHRVRVWFGEHAIADYIADADKAADYEAGMRQRFQGLRVTNDPLQPGDDAAGARELPSKRLWKVVPPH